MTVVRLKLTQVVIDRHPDTAAVQDVVWAFATSGTGLEHVRVAAQAEQIDIAIFCTARNAVEAHAAATRAIDQACRLSPLLVGWRIQP
jgi:hypothetical protein